MMEAFEFRAMNSRVLLAAEGEPRAVEEGFRHARALIEEYERRWTRFSETSELSLLNSSAGGWFSASPELYALLRQAREFYLETEGLFEPAVLPALKVAGYDRTMDEIRANGGSVPEPEHSNRTGRFSISDIELNGTGQVRLPRGMEIDLGGIAKGWIAERAAHELARFVAACAVNAGGDLYTVGLPEGELDWQIELEDPRDPDAVLALLRVGAGGVATSSVAKRQWQQGERARHHLIDPRTGEPAETDWLAVTVIAPHTAIAEVYAKALLIAGPGDAERLAEKREDIAFIAIDREGALWGSENAAEYVDVGYQNA